MASKEKIKTSSTGTLSKEMIKNIGGLWKLKRLLDLTNTEYIQQKLKL